MADRDLIKATLVELCGAVRKGEDAKDPAVEAAVRHCEETHAAWREAGARLPASEPVLQAANALLDALHEVNPEGLPYPIRDRATEMQTLLDEAELEGFTVATPMPLTP